MRKMHIWPSLYEFIAESQGKPLTTLNFPFSFPISLIQQHQQLQPRPLPRRAALTLLAFRMLICSSYTVSLFFSRNPSHWYSTWHRTKGKKKPRGRTLPTQNPTAQLQGTLPTAHPKNPRAGERTEPEGCFLLKKMDLNDNKILCTTTDCIKSLNCSGCSCASTQAGGRNARIISPSTGCFV